MDKNSCALLEFFKSFKQPEPENFARVWVSDAARDEKNLPNTNLPIAEALMNSCCALASFALSQQAAQNLDADQTYEICAKWLANFEFSLAEWNYARSISFTVLKMCKDKAGLWYNGASEKFDIPTNLVPATRNSILTCIYDILKFISLSTFDGEKKNYPPWLINPLDLRKFFMFSPESMRMNSFDLGASLINRSVQRELEKEKTESVTEKPAPKPAPRQKKPQKSFAKVAKSG